MTSYTWTSILPTYLLVPKLVLQGIVSVSVIYKAGDGEHRSMVIATPFAHVNAQVHAV